MTARPPDTIREGILRRAEGARPARIAPSFLRLGVLDITDPWHMQAHRHNEYEVILIDRGRYGCSVNGQAMELLAGDGVVVKPGDIHADRIDGPFPTRYFALSFVFRAEALRPGPPDLFWPGTPPTGQRFGMELESVWPLVLGIQSEGQAPDSLAGNVQDALLLAFFWRMVRALPRESLSDGFVDVSVDQVFAARLTRLFRSHIAQDLSVADMARLLGMSASALSHKCRELLDTSPRRAFVDCKMDRARYLLTHTDRPVKQIAAELGYADPYSFSRAFKSVTGQSPTGCRRES
jgi:AraC-like DNA-binding protein